METNTVKVTRGYGGEFWIRRVTPGDIIATIGPFRTEIAAVKAAAAL